MGNKHKHYDVIVAWAAGEAVEIKDDDGIWVPFTNANHVIFYEDMEYRIKPKTVKKEGWANVYGTDTEGDSYAGFIWATETKANEQATKDRVTCIRIEWEEEQ
jgi:hypothetical protein